MRLPVGVVALACMAGLCGLPRAYALGVPLEGSTKPKDPRSAAWTLREAELSVEPGETVILHVEGEIPREWHTYSLKKYELGPNPTKIELDSALELAGVISADHAPKIDLRATKIYGQEIEIYTGKVVFDVPFKLKAALTGDVLAVKITVSSQICSEGPTGRCMQPNTTNLTLNLKKKVSNTLPATANLTAPKPGTLKKPVEWNVESCPDAIVAKPGAIIPLKVKAMIDTTWHTFALTEPCENISVTRFEVEPKGLVKIAGPIEADRPPKRIHDEYCDKDIDVYEDAVGFTVPVQILGSAPLGVTSFDVKIFSQACSNKCIQINKVLTVAVNVSNEAAGAICPSIAKPIDPPAGKHDSFWTFLLAAALGGAGSLLTPCVFPMIPITVSFFTKRQHVSRSRAVRDALIFSAGIVLTYVGLGFFFALALGANIRDLATNPWMNLGIFAVFMVMAFNLFGFYELQIPTGLVNRLNRKAHGGNSIFALLLMGLVFTMTSFTCTGPFVGTVMIWAVRGDWIWPLAGMTVFATVFAAPFFFLALFPTMLKSLPKSGGWMNSIKVVMGFIEIAAALKFLSGTDLTWHWEIITRPVFVGIWLLLAVLTVLYLFGKIRFPHDSKIKRPGPARIAFAFIFLSAAAFLAGDLAGYSHLGPFTAYVPPRPYPPRMTDDWESGLAAGRKAGKPVFFDFTGVTCVNCRLMEEQMFERSDIQALMKNFVIVRLYTDVLDSKESADRSARNAKIASDRFNTFTLPFYVIVSPDDKVVTQFDDGFTDDRDKFAAFLQTGAEQRPPEALAHEDDWLDGLQQAKTANKPALFKFIGVNGVACPVMEENVLGNNEVRELIKNNFVEVKLLVAPEAQGEHSRGVKNAKLEKERFKMEANPFFVIISPEDRELARFDDGCIDDPRKFIDFLKKGIPAKITQVTETGIFPMPLPSRAKAFQASVSLRNPD